VNLAVVTYLYPAATRFVPGFLANLAQQDGTEFDLLVFNDGVAEVELLFRDSPVRYSVFSLVGNIAEIRCRSFGILSGLLYDGFVFQDVDDWMTSNRVSVSSSLLGRYPLVCNDLALADEGKNIVCDSTWSQRLPDGFTFDHRFLLDKNIAGLGNSSVTRNWLQRGIQVSDLPVAVDWFLFYQLMYESQSKAVFTSSCKTLYRQHAQNTAGMRAADPERLQHVLRVCDLHYAALEECGYSFLQPLRADVHNKTASVKASYIYNTPLAHQHLYWWEEKNYIYDKV
jgi:hypothetical protein